MCVLLLKFEKNAAFLLKTRCSSPAPPNTMLKIRGYCMQVVVFNIVWGVGAEVRQVKLYSRLACAQKHQLKSENLSQDFCP